MIVLRVVLLLIGVQICQCQTDLTLLNCPSQFNLTASNVTISSDYKTIGSFIFSSFLSAQSTIQNIVVRGDSSALNSYITSAQIPYYFLAGAFGLFFIITVILCLFDHSCPPCQSCRRDLIVKPYTKKEIRVITVFTVLIALGIMILCVISLSYFPDIKKNLALTKCSLYVNLDSVLYGNGIWGGFVNLQYSIGNITNSLSSAITKISTFFPGDQFLYDNMIQLKNQNLDIYKNNINAQLITSNPDSTASAINAGQNTPLIDSVFIKTGLGPNGTFNTMVDDIDRALSITQKLSNQAYAVDQSTKILVASAAAIQNNSISSQNTLLMYINQLASVRTQLDSFSQTYFTESYSIATAFFQAIIGLVLAASLITFLGLIATHLFDLLQCRKMVHLGWVLFAISYFGIIVCTYILLSVGSLGQGFCDYFNTMLTDKDKFNLLNAAYSQNTFSRIDTCIFGDGDALKKFNIAQQMNTVTNLFTNIATFNNFLSSSSTSFIDLTISPAVITGWISAMNSYAQGIYVDAVESQRTNDNPNYALSQLNLYSNTGGGVATGSRDVWVWDATNCTNPSQTTYRADNTLANGQAISTTQVTCISFNEKIIATRSNIWSQSDFTSRYIQIKNSYPDAYTKIIYYGYTLINFRDSRVNLFNSIATQLNALKTNNINFNNLIAGFQSRVTQFYGSTASLNNLITNPLNGLVTSSNCSTLKDSLVFTYNMFCVNVMGPIAKLTLTTLLLLLLMVGAICAGCSFGIRYAEVQKNQRLRIHQEGQIEQNISKADLTVNSYSTEQDV